MNEHVCFLVSVLYGTELVKTAVKIPVSKLIINERDYLRELSVRKLIYEMLPLHVKTCGPIVAVEEIFEVHEVSK